jgi:hypothetical protein
MMVRVKGDLTLRPLLAAQPNLANSSLSAQGLKLTSG